MGLELIGPDAYSFDDWREVRELRRMIELDGIPDDPEDIRSKFVAMVKNAEGLYVFFGRQWDESARRECFAMLHVIRQTHHWKRAPNYSAPATLH